MHDGWLRRLFVRFSRHNGAGRSDEMAAHLACGAGLRRRGIAESDANASPPATQPLPETPRSGINEISEITGWDEV